MNPYDLLAALPAALLAATGTTTQTDDPRQPWVITVKPAPQKPTQKPVTPAGSKPADVLNLADWKLTLPIGDDEKPTEIKQPALDGFAQNPYFVVQGNGIRFRSPVNGRHHGRFQLPPFGAARDDRRRPDQRGLVRHRRRRTALQADHLELPARPAVPGEVRGQRRRGQGLLQTAPQVGTLEADFDGGYFKAGAHTQANCEKSSPCDASNYAEAVIYNVTANHS
jgi:hypothetical protein